MENEHKLYKVSQWLMLMHKDKCLVLKSAMHGFMEFPGGRIDKNETDVEKAMRREILEETGIRDFVIIDQLGWEAWSPKADINTLMSLTLAKTTENDVQLSFEHSGYRWVSEDDVESLDFHWARAKELMKKGFKIYKNI